MHLVHGGCGAGHFTVGGADNDLRKALAIARHGATGSALEPYTGASRAGNSASWHLLLDKVTRGVAAGHDDIAAVTSTLRNIRLGFAQDAAATRVQRAMRAFLLRKGTIIITIASSPRSRLLRAASTFCAAATEPSGSATNVSHPEHDLWRASQPHSAGAKKKKKKTSRTRQEKKQGKREAAAREAAAAAAARAAAQAAAQAAQAAALGRDKRELPDRSSDDSSSDQDSCGSGSTSAANDIFDTLDDHLGYGSDSGFGW
ncbi:hypothetical protein EMIHUDRAFT_204478 [Emiliania huxleyi CCMP1516]|uniref:Uncharacterized protein n=2 Tax=Emiliania huxleyi TaxID=2903 RepID=A0A0D3JYH1_EMIH1|nr:hypothetical protein EMIHUDRAFT_204478 [Emiliania huxleyi CCMP1516]EOD28556.1 hypothetical protein EMIHUDRAFT_204478 [Emiliania huxleyi CCMP1516]|eukprot:XP_005780985.1 hypothetical protein EMIHUDRAFT_204478 [Emiliania huxleyi CCMP1516]